MIGYPTHYQIDRSTACGITGYVRSKTTDTGYTGSTAGIDHFNCTCGCCTPFYNDGNPNIVITSTRLDYDKMIFENKERERIRIRSNNFNSQVTTYQMGVKLKNNYRPPNTIKRKLSAYSCLMRGRNKPCRRIAVVNNVCK